MKVGAKLKAKAGPDKNKDEFFFIYAAPGTMKMGAVKEGAILGTYEKTKSYLLTDYAYVKLFVPLTYNGTRYEYGYIRQDAVYEYTPSLTTYYAKPTTVSVNVRSSPTSASTKNVIGSIKANQVVGSTDGTTQNGYFLFTLAKGGTGWVSRNYITSTVPSGSTSSSAPGTNVDVTSNPADDSVTDQVSTRVENSVGSAWLPILKWVGIALVALALGITVAKLYEKRNK